MKMLEKLKELEDMRKQFKSQQLAVVKEGIAEFFKEQDVFKMLHFHTWTPSFNDGEPCEYSQGGISAYSEDDSDLIQAAYEYELEEIESDTPIVVYGGCDCQCFNLLTIDPKVLAYTKDVINALDQFDWEDIVGTNCSVTITAKGIETEEYYCGY